MLLGQPTVAQMRSCLAKLEPEVLLQEGGEEAGLLALEELEFHCEDLDNANNLANMGGVRALLDVGADALAGDEVREMALGVVAAGLQNPPFQKACVSLGVPEAMLRLLVTSEGRWSSRRRPVPLARRCSRTRYGHGVRSVFTCSSFQFVLHVLSKPTVVHMARPRPRLPFRSPMPGELGPLELI